MIALFPPGTDSNAGSSAGPGRDGSAAETLVRDARGDRVTEVDICDDHEPARRGIVRFSLEQQSEFLRTLANSEPTTVIQHHQQLLGSSEDPMSASPEAASGHILSEGRPEPPEHGPLIP